MRRRTSCRLLPNHRASLSGNCLAAVLDGSQLSLRDGGFLFGATQPSDGDFLILEWSSLEFLPLFFLAQRFPVSCPPDRYRKLWTAYLETPLPFNTLVTKRSNLGIACNVIAAGLALCTTSPLPSSTLSGSPLAMPLCTSSAHQARSYKNAPGPFEAEGYTPHGQSGTDVGPLVSGAGASVVRTRSIASERFRDPW